MESGAACGRTPELKKDTESDSLSAHASGMHACQSARTARENQTWGKRRTSTPRNHSANVGFKSLPGCTLWRLTLRGSPGMTPRRVPVYLLQVYLHLGGRYAFDVGSVPPPGGKYTQAAARRGPSGPAPLARVCVCVCVVVSQWTRLGGH